jgi:hypothetical protein
VVIISSKEHESRVVRSGNVRAYHVPVVPNKYRTKTLTKKEIQDVFWYINVIKAALLLLKCSSSMTKWERRFWSFVQASWAS